MPPALHSTFFEPLVHGWDRMLAKAERVITRQPLKPEATALQPPHHRDLVNLPGVIEQIAAHHQDEAAARAIHFSIDVAPDALVVGDFHELYRVVEQFLISALENASAGGCVTVTGEASDGVVTLSLSSGSPDTPPGSPGRFPEGSGEDEPLHSSRWRSSFPSDPGQILREHGGHVSMVQHQGRGLRFMIRLPVK